MGWVDCKDRLPEMRYNSELDYWYSDTVIVLDAGVERERALRGHQKDKGGWGSGCSPTKWKPLIK